MPLFLLMVFFDIVGQNPVGDLNFEKNIRIEPKPIPKKNGLLFLTPDDLRFTMKNLLCAVRMLVSGSRTIER
jgi:hypothetical protein